MEYDNSEESGYSSSSESFTSESTNCERKGASKKIAELERKIAELKKTTITEEEKIKTRKEPSKQSQPQILEDEPFGNKAKTATKKARKGSSKQNQRSEENDTEFSSDDPEQPIFKKKNINYQKIPYFLHIPTRIWRGYMESMRLLVAERLYPLCPTTEYRDMPLIEINKCIDKFHKKNPSFPETVSDWAEREMIRRHVNYRRSTLNLSETNEIQRAIKSRKPNGNSRKAKKGKQSDKTNVSIGNKESRTRNLAKNHEPLLESNRSNTESLELNNHFFQESSKAFQESHSGCRLKVAQRHNDDEQDDQVDSTSQQRVKRPGYKHQAVQQHDDDEQTGQEKEVEATSQKVKRPGRKRKAVQHDDDEQIGQEKEVEVTSQKVKRPGRKREVVQQNDDDEQVEVEVTSQKVKRPGRKRKAVVQRDDDEQIGQEKEVEVTSQKVKRPPGHKREADLPPRRSNRKRKVNTE